MLKRGRTLANQDLFSIFATEKILKTLMEEKMVVGRNLKALREANGYTQEQVANFLGIGRSAYANYEAGGRETPMEVMERVGELFGCELALLFDEDEQAVKNMLVCAFRADNLSVNDMKEVAAFKNIVLNYMKMERLMA